MADQDFFGFCTSLKPLERKAIGELSHVRHLGPGQTIYAPGDPGDALYIISRGVVEAFRTSADDKPETYLSRGDIFGDVEVLTELPRKFLVRTHDRVSLQCFHRKDLPELIQRAPSFFLYLSEQLAFRLSRARDVALTQSHRLELSGSLSNFDLITIYQTIANSAQTGQLRITNENSELVSAFCFENGQPVCGQFEHLTGEEAFWQLFINEALSGTFSFATGERTLDDWIQSERITRNAGEMLIHALQARDEFVELKQRLSESTAPLRRQRNNLAWPPVAPPDLQVVAEQVWQLAASGSVTLDALFRNCSVCEWKIFRVVDELIQSHHFAWASAPLQEKVA